MPLLEIGPSQRRVCPLPYGRQVIPVARIQREFYELSLQTTFIPFLVFFRPFRHRFMTVNAAITTTPNPAMIPIEASGTSLNVELP